MSSLKESDVATDTPNEHVNSSDGASFEEENMIDEDDVDVGSKRKKKPGAWLHFEEVEVVEEGKKVKKHQCNHCKKLYKPQASKTTSQLNQHLKRCSHMKRLKDGLGTIDDFLVKIREGVKYLKKSAGRLLKFGEISVTHGIQTHRSLRLDVKTRWNSTQHMLESAIHYKLAFEGYTLRDSNFEWSLMDEEWDRAKKVNPFLWL
ncbi:hypothetical protein M8C21_017232 [Ambrosia artemisiifolia]|uniref:BED-type domain-containing protein n=1 Tax=Ambrosia artemisiifolia TaxID=4212 RepID=A0AAD5GKA5_AMBAR|nr:hypothetical protein M8C21_017232 [Ambrosia artemisiifolia]